MIYAGHLQQVVIARCPDILEGAVFHDDVMRRRLVGASVVQIKAVSCLLLKDKPANMHISGVGHVPPVRTSVKNDFCTGGCKYFDPGIGSALQISDRHPSRIDALMH